MGLSDIECVPRQWEVVGSNSRLNPSSDLLSISLLISETGHTNNKREDWNVRFQDNVASGYKIGGK